MIQLKRKKYEDKKLVLKILPNEIEITLCPSG